MCEINGASFVFRVPEASGFIALIVTRCGGYKKKCLLEILTIIFNIHQWNTDLDSLSVYENGFHWKIDPDSRPVALDECTWSEPLNDTCLPRAAVTDQYDFEQIIEILVTGPCQSGRIAIWHSRSSINNKILTKNKTMCVCVCMFLRIWYFDVRDCYCLSHGQLSAVRCSERRNLVDRGRV